MRPELELTELIEKYLRNELSPADKAEFEKRMATDTNLQREVQLQREIVEGTQRAALKQRAQQAYKQYNAGQNFFKYGLSTIVIILATAAVLYFVSRSEKSSLPELNENGESVWADADKHLPEQTFTINAQQDTVIVTKGGIVMAVPANCFLDNNGKPAAGEIEIEVKEALDAAAIMQAGLSTSSGDKLLETGGMFYLNARKDGSSLKIDPGKGVYAEIPTSEAKEDMMLFEGRRMPDGTIDWQNPKPLEKFLLPVDVLSLDLYPPDYLDSLAAMGYDVTDKKFTDSLYYSFAFGAEGKAVPATNSPDHSSQAPAPDPGFKIVQASYVPQAPANDYGDTAQYYYGETRIKGIDPAKVKAIWSSDFNNTLIATREFEKRMPFIHRTCNNAVLDIYLNNLDKNLCTLDSMAAELAGAHKSTFLEFARMGDGRVKDSAPHLSKLKELYHKRTKAEALAIAETQKRFWDEQTRLDVEAIQKNTEQGMKDIERVQKNFNQELEINLDEAYRQLGLQRMPPPPPATYSAMVTTTGWNNVDKYVLASTTSRTTLDYTDPNTGKKAVIRYEALSVQVRDHEQFDRLYVYLLPDKLSSFMRVKGSNGLYNEKLNELMKYKLACIGYKGDEVYLYWEGVAYPKEYKDVTLVKTSSSNLASLFNTGGNSSQSGQMQEELRFHEFTRGEEKRKQKINDIIELRARIEVAIFPCGTIGESCNPRDERVANGEMLYKKNCSVCHSTGNNVITGPGMAGLRSRLPEYAGDQWLHQFIKDAPAMKATGDKYAVQIDKEYAGSMSSFTFLSDREVEDIIAYIDCISLGGPQSAPPGGRYH